jgi:hypothetical protein
VAAELRSFTSGGPKERVEFVRSLPQVLDMHPQVAAELEQVFEMELIPEPKQPWERDWTPPVNPGRVELENHLTIFKRGAEQGGLTLTPEMLLVLIASTEEALRTMHGIAYAG